MKTAKNVVILRMSKESDTMVSPREVQSSFLISLSAGGVAGTVTDISLYPLDTIKTRLQSPQGFLKSGGFSGVYKGLGAAALGSAPGSALFFATYEKMKEILMNNQRNMNIPTAGVHMIAASMGEVVACTIRVPTEVVKQRIQAGMSIGITNTVNNILTKEGVRGLYTGFGVTLMREIPFSLIQFPMYEKFKIYISDYRLKKGNKNGVYSYEAALCGSISGGIAAAITTPLDVIKTRLMLAVDVHGVPYKGFMDTLKRVYHEGKASGNGGHSKLFSGIGPRVMWISIGGFVYFGAYEKAKSIITSLTA